MNPIAIQPPDDANDRDREAQNAFYGPDNEQEGDDDDDPNNLEQQDKRHPRNWTSGRHLALHHKNTQNY